MEEIPVAEVEIVIMAVEEMVQFFLLEILVIFMVVAAQVLQK
jgi:hypothetical protein